MGSGGHNKLRYDFRFEFNIEDSNIMFERIQIVALTGAYPKTAEGRERRGGRVLWSTRFD